MTGKYYSYRDLQIHYKIPKTNIKSMIENQDMTQSMSIIGKCIDNGPMEGFW